jgi:hypothetical protein
LRQLGDVRRDPPSLIAGERLSRRAQIIEIDIGEVLTVADAKASSFSTDQGGEKWRASDVK